METGLFQWLSEVYKSPLALIVVLTLAIMSLYSLTVAIERFYTFRKMRKATIAFLPAISQALEAKDLRRALDETRRHKNSHIAKVLAGGLHEYLNQDSAAESDDDFDLIDAVQRNLERSSALTAQDLRKGLNVLATVGSTAPFVGLLGTVGGIIRAFQGMAASGSGGLGSVSAGIAEALYTTAFGLAAAIPAVWLFNILAGKVEYFTVEMNNSASELVAYFSKMVGRVIGTSAAGGKKRH